MAGTRMPHHEAADEYFRIGRRSLDRWQPLACRGAGGDVQVIDMFSGCGGMSLGFAALSQALGAFELVGAVDLNARSLETYHQNFAVPAVMADVRELARSSRARCALLSRFHGYRPNRPTVLIGCAPCQGFSAHRKKNWNEADERNGLIAAFTKVAISMQPDCIVMENVPELLSSKYWSHFAYFRKSLKRYGYVVKQAVHNAATQGVPQERFRALVVAMKRPFLLPFPRRAPRAFRTVRDAIGNLPRVAAGERCEADLFHKCAAHRQSTLDVIKAVPKNGGSRPPGVGPKCLQQFAGFADVYGRLRWDRPAITITHYARNPASGRFVHPEQDRGLTMREAARLQSFPDGFSFAGTADDVYRQIGEAVPPLLALAVAASILASFRGELPDKAPVEDLVVKPVNNSFAGVIAGLKMSRR
jgi:DNA (cytosine-5)-methyltransferase 1